MHGCTKHHLRMSTTEKREMANFCGGFSAHTGHKSIEMQRSSHTFSAAAPLDPERGGEETQEARVAIKDVVPHQANTVIVGIVVTKQRMHSFPDKRNSGVMRCKFTFTLRDSPSDYINATCWGSEEHIRQLHSSFKICDVVEIQNGQISSKSGSGGTQTDKWCPWTPSQYQLHISETYSSLSLYNDWDYTEFTALAHVPLRSPSDFHPLCDIVSAGQSLEGSHVNILAVVKHVCAVREMTSKNGKPLKKCDIHLMDEGCTHFMLVMWDDELIDLAQTWTPRENIIFAVDVKVSYDNYHKCMSATCDQKTIITTNPDCREAHQLYQYAQTVDSALFEEPTQEVKGQSTDNSKFEVANITRVYTVEEIKSELLNRAGDEFSFAGIVFSYLTTFDIDQNMSSVLCYKCTKCGYRIDRDSVTCSNKLCSSVSEDTFASEAQFSMLVSLTDCTGTIDSVSLTGQAAAALLDCSPCEFLMKDEGSRTEIKTGLLLERFKVYLKCTSSQRKVTVHILSIDFAAPKEMAVSLEQDR